MSDSGSFVAKPARGWLHPDSVLASDGVTYAVRYIGCMEVLTSMKKLDFETRSQVAKECIARVCAAAGLRSADKKRRVCQAAARALAARPRMAHSGANVALIISSKAISLAALEGGETIARHDMPRVSFASGGDADSLDFVAYVAKSAPPTEWRACYVLECGGRLAQDVIATIGQAFELRFKEFLTKPSSLNINGSRSVCESACAAEEREYYNDMPDKIPPDAAPSHRHPPPPPLASLASLASLAPLSSCEESVRHYVNQTPPPRTPPTALLPNHHTDIFDMQPFTAAPASAPVSLAASSSPAASSSSTASASASSCAAEPEALPAHAQAALLAREPWFHGPISRTTAEKLVVEDGQFLVRESTACAGQFVLTGARRGVHKHLLLVDPNGVVRTKDRVFDSVPHLIKYHCTNELPIVSADSALLLRKPVFRSAS
ncbi:SHC-transforming protein 1 isoform X1 [Manduca sexta]|uniref:SHC-transforming protein 1 isoform X1 n=2 Tax=Manduca sexta TaxID=7130 RepID=UPI00188F5063|nr:SHC-transforming protein 1 isoform X1 [Manduca sexta]